jgi:putative peptidoglycan lipid II flippase
LSDFKIIKKGLLKATINITILSFIGIVFGFISQLIIAYYFGVSLERDAYFAAIVVPTYITSIITGSIGFVFLPKVIELRNDDNQDYRRVVNIVFVNTALVLLVLIFLGIFFSENILRITAPGLNNETMGYTKNIYKILLLSSFFNVFTSLISSLYQINNKFIRPAIAPLLTTLFSIMFVLILNSKIGIMSLAIGYLVGSLISLLIVLPILFTKEFRFNFHIDIFNVHFVSILKVSYPLILGGILFRSAPLLERMIASTLPSGSISILGYSSQFIATLGTITTSGIIVSFFPSMSDAWTKDLKLFNKYINKGLRSVLLLTIPIAFTFVLFGDTIIKILLQRGEFTHEDTLAVSETFALMTPAFIMLCLGGITSKIYYISKRTLVLTIISSFELICYFFLSYFLSQKFGYKGIAISTSIVYSFFMIIYIFYATRFILEEFNYKIIMLDVLKITFISLFSFVAGKLLFEFNRNYIDEYFNLILSLILSVTLYLFILKKIKNDEILYLIELYKKKVK